MKTITQAKFVLTGSFLTTLAIIGCAANPGTADQNPLSVQASSIRIEPEKSTLLPPFRFNTEDSSLLDEIQHETFIYFWEAVSPETGMVYDRTSSDVISVAGVGFQLAVLPIGVERGWITKEDAEARSLKILHALESEPSNRKAGLFYHFINPHDASARRVGRELVVSTVDSALLFAGMIAAGQYFEGETQVAADRIFAQADWSFFLADTGDESPPGEFMTLGWKPSRDDQPNGNGELLPYFWLDSGDEHRLATLLGVCAPRDEFKVDTSVYWSLRRELGYHEGQGHIVWFPYSGALFTSFFAHLFIDYASLGTDSPNAHGQSHRASVDWWENSRRTVHLHRDRAIKNPNGLPTLGPDAWGFSASDGPDGYLVSGQFPKPVTMVGALPNRDFAEYLPEDNWGTGVIAPYAAGSCIMFEPELAVDTLRFARDLKAPNGGVGVWREKWGFADAYRLDESGHIEWVAEDWVAISQGPLILGIENARTGLIWELIMSHPAIQEGIHQLGLDQSK